MANFDFDQAEGLRRMLAGARPRIVSFVSATPRDDKGAMLVNLGASLAQAGNDVLLVDASAGLDGVAARLGIDDGPCLLDLARQHCMLEAVIRPVRQGFRVAALAPAGAASCRPEDAPGLARAFDALVAESAIIIVDADFDGDAFPLPLMGSSEIVVQVSTSAASITAAYGMLKRLRRGLGARPFSVLVTGASEVEARVVFDNMAQAASRYLALELTSLGSVPADEYLRLAARLGCAVVDAFPLAGASVAFRRLAGRFARPAAAALHHSGSDSHFSV